MKETTLERIRKEAEEYISQIPYSVFPGEKEIIKAYEAGAIAERNKVLQEAIETISNVYGVYMPKHEAIETLESLKLPS